MSAYKQLKCEIVSQELLMQALSALGLNASVHTTAQKLTGYRADEREQIAEIIVSRQELNKTFTGCSNDLGFKWDAKENRFDIICSDYDISSGVDGRVKQAYAKVAIEKALSGQKFTISSVTDNKSLRQRKRTKINIVAQKVI